MVRRITGFKRVHKRMDEMRMEVVVKESFKMKWKLKTGQVTYQGQT